MEELVVCKLLLRFGYDSTTVLIILREEDKASFEDDILNMTSAIDGSSSMVALNKIKGLIGGRVVDVKFVDFNYTPIDKFNFWNGGKNSRWYGEDSRLNIETEVYNWYFLEG